MNHLIYYLLSMAWCHGSITYRYLRAIKQVDPKSRNLLRFSLFHLHYSKEKRMITSLFRPRTSLKIIEWSRDDLFFFEWVLTCFKPPSINSCLERSVFACCLRILFVIRTTFFTHPRALKCDSKFFLIYQPNDTFDMRLHVISKFINIIAGLIAFFQ